MGDAGPVMDDDMDVNEFFQILAEPPVSPIQVKAPQEESIEEQQLNIGTPPMGLDSSNFNLHYDLYSDKEHGTRDQTTFSTSKQLACSGYFN
jgi:hypothetical protein